jgi:hypothetical protein
MPGEPETLRVGPVLELPPELPSDDGAEERSRS